MSCVVDNEGRHRYLAPCVILTTGTFLKALMHTGEAKTARRPGRRFVGRGHERQPRRRRVRPGPVQDRHAVPGQRPDHRLLEVRTPGRRQTRRGRSASARTRSAVPQIDCHLTTTTPAVHDLIRANLHRAPMYSGQISGRGPRYCPSIEDKVVRFAEKDGHQIFPRTRGAEHPRVLLQRHQHQPAQGRAAGDAERRFPAWRTPR